MADDIQRQALVRSIAIRLQLLAHAELRVVDDVVTRLCQRASDRRRPTEVIDDLIAAVEAELAQQDRERAELHEAARAEMLGESEPMPSDDAICASCEHPMARHRTPGTECVAGDCLCDRFRRQQAIEVAIGIPGDNVSLRPMVFDPAIEFAADRHLTRVSGTPATLAPADVARDRDENLELEWGVDEHAGSGS